MSDLISRRDAIDAVIKRDANCGLDSAEVLKALPPVQPERKTGRWIWDYEGYYCSECFCHAYGCTNECLSGEWHYCPKCGAKMEGEQDE